MIHYHLEFISYLELKIKKRDIYDYVLSKQNY